MQTKLKEVYNPSPKFSILFLNYDPEGKLENMATEAYDALIKHSKGEYELLIDSDPGGSCVAVNRLLSRAKGDYMIIIANDVIVETDDWLNILCVPETITSWHVGKFHWCDEPSIDGATFCIPKTVLEKVGLFDERFKDGYGYDDNDWLHRANLLGIKQEARPILVKHKGRATFDTYFTERQNIDMMQKNRNLYFDKWKY